MLGSLPALSKFITTTSRILYAAYVNKEQLPLGFQVRREGFSNLRSGGLYNSFKFKVESFTNPNEEYCFESMAWKSASASSSESKRFVVVPKVNLAALRRTRRLLSCTIPRSNSKTKSVTSGQSEQRISFMEIIIHRVDQCQTSDTSSSYIFLLLVIKRYEQPIISVSTEL